MAEKNSLKVVAGLFRNTDKKGGIYYSGKSEEGEEYVMFRNSYWKEGERSAVEQKSKEGRCRR